ncbi:hypothetical protein [uncultured Parolsenella sp.]|uniref:hypothetical protein n=1 Tax=uncultured Parolsenella sp. TaxID=2083008 RepID=UPI0025FFCBCE|nr:hypothetical protein [uncultured Parolsenella sp.]
MPKIKLMLDYLQGPIWKSDVETGRPNTGISVVDNDEELRRLNYEISELYSSYYEFDSHGQACWFNEEQEKADKGKMLDLLNKLNERLTELNDGSFEVEDLETPRVGEL